MISVVMSVYNEKKEWIKEAIDSILSQSYNNIELIIVLDNPEAVSLKKYLMEFENRDKRVVVIVNKKNQGLAMSLNKGIEFAHGEYIARMDADDISLPDRLKIEKDYLDKHKEISMVGTNIEYIDEAGNDVLSNTMFVSDNLKVKKALRYTNVFKHPTLMFRLKDIKKVGKYNDINPAQDYELITRMVLKGYKIANLNVKTLKYRIRSNSITSNNALMQMINAEYIRVNYKKGNYYTKKSYEYFKNKWLKRENKFEKSQFYFIKAGENSKKSKILYYWNMVLSCFFSFLRAKKIIYDKYVQTIK